VDQLREATCRAEYDQMLALLEQVVAWNESFDRRFCRLVGSFLI